MPGALNDNTRELHWQPFPGDEGALVSVVQLATTFTLRWDLLNSTVPSARA